MSENGKILTFPDLAALDSEATAWVARFDAGEVSAKDQAAFQAWLNRSAQHREAIAAYGTLWSEFDQLRHLTDSEAALLPPVAPPRAWSRLPKAQAWLAACAAALIVAAGAGIFLRQEMSRGPQLAARPPMPARQLALVRPSGPQSYATAVGAQKKFALADGTLVTLNTNSLIKVEMLGDRRDVRLLRGEAYFDVVHDKTRPFTVYADRYVVRDIGTAFAVHLMDNCLVNVRVTKGSVEIGAAGRRGKRSEGPKSLGIVLAGHDVLFGRKIEHAETVSDAELSRKLAWRQGQLIYSGQPLSDVLADISRYSDVEIDLADPALKDLPVGGAFSANQTGAIIAALENNFGIRADWIDSHHVRLSSATGKSASAN